MLVAEEDGATKEVAVIRKNKQKVFAIFGFKFLSKLNFFPGLLAQSQSSDFPALLHINIFKGWMPTTFNDTGLFIIIICVYVEAFCVAHMNWKIKQTFCFLLISIRLYLTFSCFRNSFNNKMWVGFLHTPWIICSGRSQTFKAERHRTVFSADLINAECFFISISQGHVLVLPADQCRACIRSPLRVRHYSCTHQTGQILRLNETNKHVTDLILFKESLISRRGLALRRQTLHSNSF